MRFRRSIRLLYVGLLILAPGTAIAHGSLDHELEALDQRLGEARGEARTLLHRGEIHRLKGNWQSARDDFDAAARVAPGLVEVDLCRAALELDLGNAAAAESLLDRVLAGTPDQRRGLELRAKVRTRLGRPLDAVADLDRLIAADPAAKPDLYHERASLLSTAGPQHLDRALAGLDQARARLGTLPSLELFAIDLELGRRGHDAALARLERLTKTLATRDLLERRGTILLAAGRDDEARAAFAAALAELESMPAFRRRTAAVIKQEDRLRARLDQRGTR